MVARRLRSWLAAFLREGVQSGLFVGYVIGVIVIIALPGDSATDVVTIVGVGVIVVVAILFRLRKYRKKKPHGK